MAVPLDTPSSSHSERRLKELEAERKRESDDRITGWAVVWTLFAFKLATVVVIWFAADGSAEANAYIAATSWYWLAIPLVAISGFVAYRLRLRQTRNKVAQLRKSEFMEGQSVDEVISFTDDEVRKLIALGARRGDSDRPVEG